MSEVTVGLPADDHEIDAYIAAQQRTWANTEDPAEWRKRIVLENTRVVRSQGRVGGGLTLIPMGQFFGGRSVPMTGIGGVGIDPADRASGLASEMMRETVRELHANGVAISALYPATQPLYRRVGYELSGSRIKYTLATEAIDVRDRELTVDRFATSDLGLIRPVYAERARRVSGNLDRSEAFWERIIAPERTDRHYYVVSGSNGPEGYCVFTQDREGGFGYHLNMLDLVAITPAAARRLLTFFADHRSMAGEVRWHGSPADPFFFQLKDQRWTAAERPFMTWMLRIIDVPRALTERGYPVGIEAELHLQVQDDVLEQNNASFVLEVSGGKACVRSGGESRVRIDVRGLAPLYSGSLPCTRATWGPRNFSPPAI